MKTHICVCALLLTSLSAPARIRQGVKEGGGDSAAVFVCESQNQKIPIRIYGFSSMTDGLELQVYLNGKLTARDAGQLQENAFSGTQYRITFAKISTLSSVHNTQTFPLTCIFN
ncbi:hypothetical protein EZJ49_00875 [Bdellovibrio bacteriovorus]|uniref:hypothetical protein n=1 Tax=Bdellovibrio bacteriovorus TaxID=959 RepID=UPI0021D3A75D|nr:hypothetical protein [Bdellovibrio bacteriovorus]UXR64807.1 hypothetical protein EZJ49_00875 [Bdellovibrio bacteriovorus]